MAERSGWICLCLLTGLIGPIVGAETVDSSLSPTTETPRDVVPPSARQILIQALVNRYELDARASVEITITGKSGDTTTRRAEVASKLVDGQIVSFGRFTYPAEMRGMTVLRFQYADRDDDFWIYLPEFRRVRRMSAALRSDMFIGTDAAFEDVERRQIDDYRVELGPSEEIDGEPVWTVRARPTYDSGYERVVYSISKDDSTILRSYHYKRGAEEPFKVIETPRATTEKIGDHTVPRRATVRNLERGTRTDIAVTRILVNPELDDQLFTLRSLGQEREMPRYDKLEPSAARSDIEAPHE